MSTSEEECPVCMDTITNPSQPTACCGKVICQTCLDQSLQHRAHCPHCRGQINQVNPLRPSTNRRRSRRHNLFGDSSTFNPVRPVGSRILNRLQQLHAAQSEYTNTANQGSLPNWSALAPAPQSQAPPLSRFTAPLFALPVPRIRAPPSVAIRAIPPAVARLNPHPAPENLEAELDEWPWQTEIHLMEMQHQQQPRGSNVRTFACPYCPINGLDELNLRDHCNAVHAHDIRSVVCPVCVALPHGDPQYYSRNFVGHLNLRHCFYTEDITNIHQSDEINIQCAIMASFAKNI